MSLLLAYLKIAQVTLVGHSLGGMVAQRFTLLYPERIKRLVLYATSRRVGVFMRQVLKLAIKIKQKTMGKSSLMLKVFKNSILTQDAHYESSSGYIQNSRIAM